MDATLACGIGSLFAGAAAAFLVARSAADAFLRRHRSAVVVSPTCSRQAAWLFRNGCKPLEPLALRALGFPTVAEAADELALSLAARGLVTDGRAIVSLIAALSLALFAGCWLVLRSPWAAAAVAACAVACVISFGRSLGERRRAAMVESVPGALRSMGVCFRAGLSLMQTMRQSGKEVGGPLGELFERAAKELEVGVSASEVLEGFRKASGIPELSFVAVALEVQHQSGGSIARVLDVARQSLENELELRRSLRVQTVQAKLSARIVTLMPFVLVALFSLVSEGFLDPFFESWAGLALLGLALGMQVAGVLLVRRVLRVEEG